MTKIITITQNEIRQEERTLLPVVGSTFRLKRMSPGELCSAYGVSDKTMAKWLKPFIKEVGRRTGQFYNPRQVHIIVSRLGIPDSEVTD